MQEVTLYDENGPFWSKGLCLFWGGPEYPPSDPNMVLKWKIMIKKERAGRRGGEFNSISPNEYTDFHTPLNGRIVMSDCTTAPPMY